MRPRNGVAWLLAVLLSLAPMPGRAAEPHVALRAGEHPGYGRLVFDLPPGIAAELHRQAGRWVIRLTPPAPIDPAPHPPRNVRAIAVSPGLAELRLAEGAQLRRMQLGRRLVIDVLDPTTAAAPAAAPHVPYRPRPVRRVNRLPPLFAGRHARPAPALPMVIPPPAAPAVISPPAALPPNAIVEPEGDPAGLVLVPDVAPPPMPPEPSSTPLASPVAAAPVAPVVHAALPAPGMSSPSDLAAAPLPADPIETRQALTAGPMALSASPVPMPGGGAGAAMALPFAAGTAAAAFREAGSAVLVFDRSRPIDMAPMKDDPVFGAGVIQLLPGATILRMKLSASFELRLFPTEAGWTVAAIPPGAGAPPLRAIRLAPAKGGLLLAAAAPGQVVSVPDPATGDIILVGTQHSPGQSLAVARRTPQFALLPGFQGVALRPMADDITLRPTEQGFRIAAGPGGALDLSPETPASAAQADASRFTRRFDFPDLDRANLRHRLLAAIDAAAATPAQARGPARLAVARAMIALGMGPEAQSVLGLAVRDDPRLAASPDQRGLAAIAALLAGRPAEAGALDDPALAGTDDIALWRAVRTAMTHKDAPQEAAVFAADAALPLAYPKPLRDHILPLIAETMAMGGEHDAARRLLDANKADHRLDLARGMLAEADARVTGADPGAALAIYDRVAAGTDRRDHARAAVRAVELRLARAGLPPAKGADALEALLDAWRGGAREAALRRRIAGLRAAAGQWRRSLAMLRESAALFPDQAESWHNRLSATFAQAIAADRANPLPPLDLVALAEENSDLIPPGAAGQALADRLADRLTALDLPARAAPVLEKLAAAAPPGPARAAFGARLAAMRLAGHDAAGALAALAASAADELPPALQEARTLTYARAAAASGDLHSAIVALAAFDTPAAIGLRADLLEGAQDWPAATAALHSLADRTLPANGTLDAAQARLMLRLASAAGQAGDEAMLAALRQSTLPRLPPGQLADMFRLLTQPPLTGMADMPRVADAVKLARALPAALNGLTHR